MLLHEVRCNIGLGPTFFKKLRTEHKLFTGIMDILQNEVKMIFEMMDKKGGIGIRNYFLVLIHIIGVYRLGFAYWCVAIRISLPGPTPPNEE